MSEELNASTFRQCQGQSFALAVEPNRALILREVYDLSGDTPRADKQPFSLVFTDSQSQADQALPQSTYRLQNATLGELDIFLVCLGPDLKDPQRPLIYEAIYS